MLYVPFNNIKYRFDGSVSLKINVIKISLLQVLSKEERILFRRQSIINFILILEKFALKTKSEVLNFHIRTKTCVKRVYAAYIGCHILSFCTSVVYILLNVTQKVVSATWIFAALKKKVVLYYIHPNALVILYFINKDYIISLR